MIHVKRSSVQSVGEGIFRGTRTRAMSTASEMKLKQVRGSTTGVQLVLGAVAESMATESVAGGASTAGGGHTPVAGDSSPLGGDEAEADEQQPRRGTLMV
jgi:hypothetical protein